MSSAQIPEAGAPSSERRRSDRRQSLSNFLSRAKSIVRGDRNKRQSVAAVPAEGTGSSSMPIDAAGDGDGDGVPAPVGDLPTPTTTTIIAPGVIATSAAPEVTATPHTRDAEYQERARKMFEKYGFTLEPHEWSKTSNNTDRVQKTIRMRVHRQCHRCNLTYGPDKVCGGCGHKRCKKCPRFPARKPKIALEDKSYPNLRATPLRNSFGLVLTIPSPKIGGKERILKDIKQRVRRVCHKCDSQFSSDSKTCSKCDHARCTKCPRLPAKLHKYPDGYPGDVYSDFEDGQPSDQTAARRAPRRSRQPVRYFCHACDQQFEDKSQPCVKCQHPRCDQCKRLPPRTSKPSSDPPNALESIEEKLAVLNIKREDV